MLFVKQIFKEILKKITWSSSCNLWITPLPCYATQHTSQIHVLQCLPRCVQKFKPIDIELTDSKVKSCQNWPTWSRTPYAYRNVKLDSERDRCVSKLFFTWGMTALLILMDVNTSHIQYSIFTIPFCLAPNALTSTKYVVKTKPLPEQQPAVPAASLSHFENSLLQRAADSCLPDGGGYFRYF